MKRKDSFVMQDIVGEKILVPIGSQVMDMNGLITLNKTAAFIWNLLSEEQTFDTLLHALVKKYNIDESLAKTDLKNFINEITEIGLLE